MRAAWMSVSGGPAEQPRGRSGDSLLELEENHHRDDDAEQRDAFDQRGQQNGLTADLGARLGLPRDRFRSATTDAADADAGADRGQPTANAGAHQRPRSRVLLRVPGSGL